MTKTAVADAAPEASVLLERYRRIRRLTESLCAPLAVEDQVVQTMPDVSPTRWHRAHTTWFFETFVLQAARPSRPPFAPHYPVLFNSYYNGVGPQFTRARRGTLSRPTVAEVGRYRQAIDAEMVELLAAGDAATLRPLLAVVEIGLHHEQQHQELILTDIKHVFGSNPLLPAYHGRRPAAEAAGLRPCGWVGFDSGLREIGAGAAGFAYDNERPRHRLLVNDFELADRLVTNAEFSGFVADGGYRRPELWLADGWDEVQRQGWRAPLYWAEVDGDWHEFTLHGQQPLAGAQPVCHVSYYEADAFARWAGARLPTEAEWETAAAALPLAGNFLDSGLLQPAPAPAVTGLRQVHGDVWEWTASPYTAYPGFAATAGALGEYNGKFMCNQLVVRGGSCLSSRDHLRPTYRSFFPAAARWQMLGLRLAR